MNELEQIKTELKSLLERVEALGKEKEIESYHDAFELITNWLEIHNEEFRFKKRLVIARVLGSRPFVYGEDNYCVEIDGCVKRIECYQNIKDEGTNYFETEEQADKYLEICLKENLL